MFHADRRATFSMDIDRSQGPEQKKLMHNSTITDTAFSSFFVLRQTMIREFVIPELSPVWAQTPCFYFPDSHIFRIMFHMPAPDAWFNMKAGLMCYQSSVLYNDYRFSHFLRSDS